MIVKINSIHFTKPYISALLICCYVIQCSSYLIFCIFLAFFSFKQHLQQQGYIAKW
jgi:hypothetical protein